MTSIAEEIKTHSRGSRVSEILPVLLLIVIPFLVYFQIAAGTATFAGYDHTGINQPLKMEAFKAIREGNLPLWESRLDRGLPLLAEGEAGIFYPLNYILLLPFDFLLLYNWLILLCLGLSGIFFYAWMRRMGITRVASWIGALAHQWGATVNFNKANVNILEGYILTPLLLLSLEPAGNEARRRNLSSILARTALFGAVYACMIFAGQAQYALYGVLFAFFYVLLKVIFGRSEDRLGVLISSGIPFLSGTILGIGLAAIQIFPQLELLGMSERATASLEEGFYHHGLWLTPGRLFAAYIFPAYHVSVDQFLPYLSTTVWVGPIAILLGGYAIRMRNHSNRGNIPVLFVCGIVFLLLAMGSNLPAVGQITSVGILGHFRGHGRLAGYFALSFLALMAFGLEVLLKNVTSTGIKPKVYKLVSLFMPEILIMVILAIPFLTGYQEYIETKAALFAFIVLTVLFLTGLGISGILKSGIPLIVSVLIALGVQIFVFFTTSSETMLLRSKWESSCPDTRYIQENSSPDEASIISIRTRASIRKHEEFLRKGLLALKPGPREHINYLSSANEGLMKGLTICNSDLPLEINRWEWLVHRNLTPIIDSTKGRLDYGWTNLLSILGVNWIVTENSELEIEGYEKLSGPVWMNDGVPYYVFRREAALRPYSIYRNWQSVPSNGENYIRSEFLKFLNSPASEDAAFVEREIQKTADGDELLEYEPALKYKVIVMKSDISTKFTANVEVNRDALFVWRDAWFPGWRVKVNGVPKTVIRANMVFKGVFLEEGKSKVEFFYDSTYLRTGMLMSALSLVILLGIVVPAVVLSNSKKQNPELA